MVEIYVKLVLSGRKTIDQVPQTLRAEVEALLAELS